MKKNNPIISLIQLPFPSQEDPLPELMDYYDYYVREYNSFFPEYVLQEGDLWEMPLWVAHLDGAIGRDDTTFIDLSKQNFAVDVLVEEIRKQANKDDILFFSPLAQNFQITSDVSRILVQQGYQTVIGGNMAELARLEDFTWIYTGLARAGVYEEIVNSPSGLVGNQVVLGRNQQSLGYVPRYRLVQPFGKRVPLLRLNASHGCLYACAFCGDAWSRQLHEVELERLEMEVQELREKFPNTKLLYIGDKTFGQSKSSVENLKKVLKPEYGYRLIVQTHVLVVNEWLLDSMTELNVEVVEMGFETANSDVLKELQKGHRGAEQFLEVLEKLNSRGFRVILNVLSGLPNESKESQEETIRFLEDSKHLVWLYNLYNFVPYPKTPLFAKIRDRIVDWEFNTWREDKPVVFEPYNQTREEAFNHFLRLTKVTTNILKEREKSRETL